MHSVDTQPDNSLIKKSQQFFSLCYSSTRTNTDFHWNFLLSIKPAKVFENELIGHKKNSSRLLFILNSFQLRSGDNERVSACADWTIACSMSLPSEVFEENEERLKSLHSKNPDDEINLQYSPRRPIGTTIAS